MNIAKIISVLVVVLFTANVNAATTCKGTIKSVYKWHHMERISVMLTSSNRWINMPTKSDEAMALMAFAANKTVAFYWAAENVTACVDGWTHNRSLNGYFIVNK
jgi:hypothetical protein